MNCHGCAHKLKQAWAHLYEIARHARDYKVAKNEFNVWAIDQHAQDGMMAIDGVCKTLAENMPENKEVV